MPLSENERQFKIDDGGYGFDRGEIERWAYSITDYAGEALLLRYDNKYRDFEPIASNARTEEAAQSGDFRVSAGRDTYGARFSQVDAGQNEGVPASVDDTTKHSERLYKLHQEYLQAQTLIYGGDYSSQAMVFQHLDSVVQNAILIDVHDDKYKGTFRQTNTLDKVAVFVSAISDGPNTIPVQFEVKVDPDKGNRMYIVVTLAKTKTGVVAPGGVSRPQSEADTSFEIMVPQLFADVNPLDGDFLMRKNWSRTFRTIL